MDKNILDKAVDKTIEKLMKVDEKAKNTPYHPYGQVPATKAEKDQQFENLDITKFTEMIQKYGKESVNEYLRKHMGGDNNGMV